MDVIYSDLDGEKMRLNVLLLLALFAAVGCAEDNSAKGVEEDSLTSGKDDSFYRPTEHGALRFSAKNEATISADARFHAWTFSLSDDATIDLATEVSTNLDSVMYLYHRENEGASWGAYLKKNDDDGGKISSRIKLEAGAGEYRVVVKAFKSAMRGSFNLAATCEGAGCVVETTSCTADTYQQIPGAEDATSTCATAIATVLSSRELSASSGSVDMAAKCDLSGIELTAVDFYRGWWSGFSDFEEQFDYGDGIELNFQTRRLEAGTVVDLDAGGDEDGITFIFDADNQLLSMFQHNQSPTFEFFCAAGNTIDSPDEECFQDVMWGIGYADGVADEGEGVMSELSGDLLKLAVQAGVEKLGYDAGDTATYKVSTYAATEGGDGTSVELTVNSDTATFFFVSPSDEPVLRLIEAGEKAQFVCE